MKLNALLTFLFEDVAYHGEHEAPGPTDGAPLHDLTINGIYPPDVYTMSLGDVVRHYGHGEVGDTQCFSLTLGLRNKPKSKVKIYRAVPYLKTKEVEISELEDLKKKVIRFGRTASPNMSYDQIVDKLDALRSDIKKGIADPENVTKINPGDWVTISRSYAVEHGHAALNGKYQILSKTVAANQLYTDGNSIQEWGWNP